MSLPSTLIVGAGPTGLTMGIELARQGLPFRLIDRSLEPARWSQALVVQARTLEQFERYGELAERAVAAGLKIQRATFRSDRRPILTLELDRIPGRYPFVLFLPQTETERLLTEHLQSLGGRVERGVELRMMEANRADGVRAMLGNSDGREERGEFRWVVGCDGAHSTVRHALNVRFEGNSVPLSFLLGDLELEGENLPGDEISLHFMEGDVVFMARLSGKVWRVILVEHGRDWGEGKASTGDFQRVIDRVVGPGIRVGEGHWISPYHVHQRKTPHYRVGSVFLAGDACHIHSPVAGQGMNTGIQDVANLGWKLGAVTRDHAPVSLLDTYDRERGLVGDRLLRRTSLGLAAATTMNPLIRGTRNLLARGASHLSAVQDRMAAFISETDIHYPRSAIVMDHGGGNAQIKAGYRVPNPELAEGGRLLDPLRDGRHLAILPESVSVPDFLSGFASVRQITANRPEMERLLGTKEQIFLIRPDGYLGFRGPDHHTPELHSYIRYAGLT